MNSLGDAIYLIAPEMWLERNTAIHEIGGKAIGLAALLATSLPVPTALVIPVRQFRDHVARAGLRWQRLDGTDIAKVARKLSQSQLPSNFVDEIRKAAAIHLAAPYAVRSSSVVEDSVFASWAGQFDTVLDVPASALERSILQCWVSAYSNSALVYAARAGCTYDPAMAVVLQTMVHRPIWAGVVFTDTDEYGKPANDMVVIECVRGLGEKLVSGTSRPELRLVAQLSSQSVRKRVIELNPRRGQVSSSGAFSDEAIRELLQGTRAIVSRLERRRVDIEWAWDGHKMWFLQARPLVTV